MSYEAPLARGLFNAQPLSLTGAALGTVAVWACMTPSLVPRAWSAQALLAAGCLIAGYAIGAFAGWSWRFLQLPMLAPKKRRIAWIVLGIIAPVGVVVLGVIGRHWQIDQRALIGMPGGVSWAWPLASFAGVLLAAGALAIGRGLRWIARKLRRLLDRAMPARVSAALAIALTAFGAWFVVQDVVTDRALEQLDAVYAYRNDQTGRGVTNPHAPPARSQRSRGRRSAGSAANSCGKGGRQPRSLA